MKFIQNAFINACRAEIEAPKPGNVHVYCGGHDMEARDFLVSAERAAIPLAISGAALGQRVLGAVSATIEAVGTNTNLGIVLLCAPLAMAFERAQTETAGYLSFQVGLDAVLDGLTVDDAIGVFQAIRLANPGGMGKVEGSDLNHDPTSPLRAIMAEAQDRDRIARAYVDGFRDVLIFGVPLLEAAAAENRESWWPATATYLGFLSTFPDTHIIRKWGADAARTVQHEARVLVAALSSNQDRLSLLLELDSKIKARGINPGTSADLAVATLFAAKLVYTLRQGSDSG